ncbi:hypothetical protein FGO68_gene12123 [Halteria grandinella]|uniref:Uncharacterized protein n=1 Tax=Halteria grandinella TaxID=5974 RepID=A0A8J8P6P9_HALGN|nr:hypothetical protein FGO68_gene12123 [Halteria grandinella]
MVHYLWKCKIRRVRKALVDYSQPFINELLKCLCHSRGVGIVPKQIFTFVQHQQNGGIMGGISVGCCLLSRCSGIGRC